MEAIARCDLHVHSVHSTDTGNFALRRARLGESYTEPGRLYEVCRRRGMTFVTISDHNTLDGALRIADRPGTFLSVEVTTRFAEDDVPLHVLVWNLSEDDHRDLQPYRPSVVDLVDFLQERGLQHALAHPLYRMGPPLTMSHVERMMLLFGMWEGRNGARPEQSNVVACRLAAAATPAYLDKLAERHGLAPRHAGTIGLTGGSDDHGGIDIATTWTEAPGETIEAFLASACAADGLPCGAHGSTVKLAHAVGSLVLHAYRRDGGSLPAGIDEHVASVFDADGDAAELHAEIDRASGAIARGLAARARSGRFELTELPSLGSRLGTLLLAGALDAPYVASLRHHAGTRKDVDEIETAFFGLTGRTEPRALVFTDTYDDTNGVAGTMRRLAAEAAAGQLPLTVVTTRTTVSREPGLLALEADWKLPLPGYEALELRFPSLREVLEEVERVAPDIVHVATPGPVGLCGMLAAKLLGIPLVGSYHTELGPYALHLTRDLVVAEAFDLFVTWFYRQCGVLLAPTSSLAHSLGERGFERPARIWGRGVDLDLFAPTRRDATVRESLLQGDAGPLLLSVGRLSAEKRVHVLLDAFELARRELPSLRLAVVGDGPARADLEARAGAGIVFTGELGGERLAAAYASADAFCFPSTTDTFGQVLLEAGASGLPALAAAVGGATELVRHGETGLLVAPDDVGALAQALVRIGRDELLRRRLGAAATAHARTRTWERSYAELREAYESVAARPFRPPVGTAA